jgi:hypothetical protein
MPTNKPTPSNRQPDQKPEQKSTPVPADDAPQREDEDLSMFLGDAKSENAAAQAPEFVNRDKPSDTDRTGEPSAADPSKSPSPGKKNKEKGGA